MMKSIQLTAQIPEQLLGMRLDQIAAQLFPQYSRSRLQQWIKSGELRADGRIHRARDKLTHTGKLTINAQLAIVELLQAQAIALDIVYEDEALLVLNKPAGLVVHPGAGHTQGTLLNALLHHCPALAQLPRAGLIHRLDKDTSGLLMVAKCLSSHHRLVQALQQRKVKRLYQAICQGVVLAGGRVDQPVGRHPKVRTKMAVVSQGKHAVTHYRIVQRFRRHTHLRLQLETGRTHQIRVHMAYSGFPLVGDPLYAGRLQLPKAANDELIGQLRAFNRQALHASCLGIYHPEHGDYLEWQTPLPEDMQQLLTALDQDQQQHHVPANP
jgi:23S rRNA pseudouridine1911/1915/1917 synthase